MIFDYPEPRSHRRHGPCGYANQRSYRPWLRDEFTFRCVYCLRRERWGQVTGEFDLDHFQPLKLYPRLGLEYSNLVYACRRCNSIKLDAEVDDPLWVLTRERIHALPDGRVRGADDAARRLIACLDLNSARLVAWRFMWIRIAERARESDRALWEWLVGFPVDLPDLRRLRPPGGNTRPRGIDESWAVRAERGELNDCY